MFGIGTPELIVIFIVALVVLGPKRLPEVARAIGKAVADLRSATSGVTEELRNARVMLEEEARSLSGKVTAGPPPPPNPPHPMHPNPPPNPPPHPPHMPHPAPPDAVATTDPVEQDTQRSENPAPVDAPPSGDASKRDS